MAPGPPRPLPAPPLLLLLLLRAGLALAGNMPACIVNTGGTCVSESCFAWRGQTECNKGRCFCTGGTCSGSDEVCYNSSMPYQQVGGEGQTYELRNARWPDYYMNADSIGSVHASKGHAEDDTKFVVRVPPYGEKGDRIFLLFSKRWPDSTIIVTYDSDKKEWPVQCARITGALGGALPDYQLRDLALRFQRAPVPSPTDNQTLVMLSPLINLNRYLYVSSTGWYVDTWQNDPGAGGYWYFDPPLPAALQASLPIYTGPRCSWKCGEAALASSAPPTALAAKAAVAVAAWLAGSLAAAAAP